MTETSRFVELCRLMNEPARDILPRSTSTAAADRLLDAALRAPDDDAALREAAGVEEKVNGYLHKPLLRDANFGNLRAFARRAQFRVGALDREISALAAQRALLARLLNPEPKGTDR